MISLIETLNQWSTGLPGLAWQMLWQSSLLIAAVFALDLALRRKARAAVRYALWLVVLLKLVIPPTLAAPTSVAWWVRSPQPPLPITPAKHYVVSYPNSQRTEPPVDPIGVFTGAAMQRSPVLSWAGRALLASEAFSIGLLTWAIFRWRQVARIVRDASPANESLTRLLDEAGRSIGVRRSVQLLLTDQPMSPAVCGLSRPVVLLPRSLAEQLPPNRLRAVLLHELTHLKRGDVWVNCLQTLLQIVYWWHPLVWLANACIRRVREEAVDDVVMLALRDDADCYAPTLLEVAKLAFRRPLASLGLVGILESRSALRQRIERLVEFSAPRRAGFSLVSTLGIAAFSALAVPMGEAPSASNGIAQAPPREPQVVVTNRGWAHANGFDWHLGNIVLASPVSTNEPPFAFAIESVSSIGDTNGTLIGRSFNLDMSKLLSALRLPTNSLAGTNWPPVFQSRFLDYFKSRGVDLGPPRSLFFHADGRTWVRATAEDLDRIEGIIAANALSKPIANWIQDGKLLFELGRYDAAEFNLKHALQLEPQNAAASYYLSLVQQARNQKASQNSGANILGASGNPLSKANLIYTSAARQMIMNKLDKIYLDDVSYDAMPLSEVTRNLSQETKQRDPDGRGVNFLISDDSANILVKIIPALTNARLGGVLDAIVKSADKPIKYSIKDYAIEFSRKTGNEVPALSSRRFKLDVNTFIQNLESVRGGGAPTPLAGQQHQGQADMIVKSNSLAGVMPAIIDWFRDEGVNLDPPKNIFYGDREGSLWVRATTEDLDIIEAAIQTLNIAPPQVDIHIKFIEMSKELADALRIDWTNSSFYGTAGMAPTTSILTPTQVRELIQALQKKSGFEKISDGQITTLSGRQAQLQFADVQMEARTKLPNTNDVTLANTLPIGPTLDVIPYVSADNYTIHMTLIPTLLEFLGYDDPSNFVIQSQSTNGPSTAVLPLPHFRLRQVSTSAIVFDGQTVVLRGVIPMQTTNQLPVLGDLPWFGKLFPNDHERTLLIFVTPTIIDPAGNRVHTDEELNAPPSTKR